MPSVIALGRSHHSARLHPHPLLAKNRPHVLSHLYSCHPADRTINPPIAMSFTLFLLTYLFGGLTFPILVIWALLQACSQVQRNSPRQPDPDLLVPEISPDLKVGELEEASGVNVYRQGWLTVTTHYFYHHTELARMADANGNAPTRSDFKKKHRFFAVLKHGNLFLYRDDSVGASVVHVVVLKNVFITLWPRDPDHEALETSLFTKKTCIAIFRKGIANVGPDGHLTFNRRDSDPSKKHLDEFFIYVGNNVEKEDWYFSLIRASDATSDAVENTLLNSDISAKTAHFKTRDVLTLIQTLNSTEGQLTTKWLNALLGRLFLGVQQTESLSLYLRDRLYKKLTKINKPGFLDDFIIESVDVGTAAPFFTNPHLKELTVDGLTRIGFNVLYRGGLSFIVSTKVNINLSSRFKKREVRIELKMTVKELSGPMVLLIKPPPTDRIWYAFETEPHLDLDVEPVVSARQLSYNMITNVIKSKFKEAIKESLVLPFMDDISFYKTSQELYRGGIWDKYNVHFPTTAEPESPAFLRKPDESANDDRSSVRKRRTSSLSPRRSDDASSVRSSSSTEQSEDFGDLLQNSPTKRDLEAVKNKTLQSVENFKSALKSPRNSSSSFSSNGSDNSSWRSKKLEVSAAVHDEVSTSKRYLQTGMKKFGKWYKDAVNTSKSDLQKNAESSPQSPPEMISSRRTIPKSKEKELASLVTNNENLRSIIAAEMFANKSRTGSASSTSSNGSPIGNTFRFSGATPSFSSTSSRHGIEAQNFPNDFSQGSDTDLQVSKTPSHISEEKLDTYPESTSDSFSTDINAAPSPTVSITINDKAIDLHELNKGRPVPPPPYMGGNQDDGKSPSNAGQVQTPSSPLLSSR